MMKLDENFSLRQTGPNVILTQWVDGFKKEGKEKVPAKVPLERNYGTIYQALQGYLNHSLAIDCDDIKKIRKIALSVFKNIESLEDKIKEKFCCEVRKSR